MHKDEPPTTCDSLCIGQLEQIDRSLKCAYCKAPTDVKSYQKPKGDIFHIVGLLLFYYYCFIFYTVRMTTTSYFNVSTQSKKKKKTRKITKWQERYERELWLQADGHCTQHNTSQYRILYLTVKKPHTGVQCIRRLCVRMAA